MIMAHVAYICFTYLMYVRLEIIQMSPFINRMHALPVCLAFTWLEVTQTQVPVAMCPEIAALATAMLRQKTARKRNMVKVPVRR